MTNQVICTTTNFSVFALFGEASASSGGSSTGSSVVRGACEGLAPGNKAAWIYGSEAKENEIKLFFADGDKPIDKYLLVYGEKPGEYLYGVEDIGSHGGGWNTYTVKGLEEGREYYFKIVGKNACKFGPWSNEHRASTLKTGSSFVNLADEGSYEQKEISNELKIDKKEESEDKKANDKVEVEQKTKLKREGEKVVETRTGGIISKGLRIIVGWWESLAQNFRGIVFY